jgi:hypothetical protein
MKLTELEALPHITHPEVVEPAPIYPLLISWMEDGKGNKIERYEGADGQESLKIHAIDGVDPNEVEAWYWHAVGIRKP